MTTAWINKTKLSEDSSAVLKILFPYEGPYTEFAISKKLKFFKQKEIPAECKKSIVEIRNEIAKALDCETQCNISYTGPLHSAYDAEAERDELFRKIKKLAEGE